MSTAKFGGQKQFLPGIGWANIFRLAIIRRLIELNHLQKRQDFCRLAIKEVVDRYFSGLRAGIF